MAEMSKAAGLGHEGAAKMAADMENQGLSAERTAQFVEQTMNDAHKMGLNASKVVKNIQANIKMLNKYNFKGGIKGLAKMAETTTKLGIDMNSVAGMADKLFDIEGAVDMSAQLQVMGGAWAKLADPFKLMYMARNDMEGLTAAIGQAAESSVHFNKESKDFEISSLEMHRLRKIAEQTNMSYEDLAKAGKHAAIYTQIKKQMNFSVDKETQEFLANTATFNDKGEATIMLDGKPKLIKTLTSADQNALKAQIKQTASLKEMAQTSQTFDDDLKNLINALKTAALPIIESLNKTLIPKLRGLFDKMEKEKWFDKIGEAAATIGSYIGKFLGWFIDNPIKTMIGIGLAKVSSFLFEKAQWLLNGLALAKGFNMGAGGKGGIFDYLKGLFSKGGGNIVGPNSAVTPGVAGPAQSSGGMFGKMGSMSRGMGAGAGAIGGLINAASADSIAEGVGAVSYTHLTLPTKRIV